VIDGGHTANPIIILLSAIDYISDHVTLNADKTAPGPEVAAAAAGVAIGNNCGKAAHLRLKWETSVSNDRRVGYTAGTTATALLGAKCRG